LQEKKTEKNRQNSFFQEKLLFFCKHLKKEKEDKTENKKIVKSSKIELPYYSKLYITLLLSFQRF